jgi:hypothetical protein
MLAILGDAWEETNQDVGLDGPQQVPINPDDADKLDAERNHDLVQAACLQINYACGVLPIS